MDAGRVRPTQKLAFATRATFSASLATGGNDPVAQADGRCNAAAQAAGLGGTWRAWISTTTSKAIDHLNDVPGGWYNFESPPQQIFANKSGGIPGRGVGFDEWGVAFNPSGFTDPVWTGTASNSPPATLAETCNDWQSTSMNDNATVGDPRVLHVASWTAGGTLACNGAAHLYCFEQ